MRIATGAIVCAVLGHGEAGAVARLLTPEHGLLAGYVRGGRSRRLRPVLLAGNLVAAEFRARTEDQLAGLTVELLRSRAPLLAEPLPAAAIDWATALTAVTLPEGHPYPRLHDALDGLLGAIEAANAARDWAGALARYERLLLADLGYGEDGDPADARADLAGTLIALRRNGDRIERDLLGDRRRAVLASRERLIDRLTRVSG